MKKIIQITATLFILVAASQNADAQSWNTTGNAGTSASTNFIGTTDNVAFKIRTKNVVRITVNGSGNVGIGTSSPTSRLHLNGSTTSTSDVFYSQNNYVGNINVSAIHGYSVPNPGWGYGVYGEGGFVGVLGQANGATSAGIAYGVYGYASGTTGNRIGVYGEAVGGAANWGGYFVGNSYFSGNVGIGVTTPTSKLMVLSSNNFSSTNIVNFIANNQTQGIGMGYDEIRKTGTTANSDLKINANGTGNLILQNTSTGNVGIGTASPASLLSVQSNSTGQTAIDINNTSTGGMSYRIQSVGSGNANRIGNFEIWRTDFGINMLTIQPGGNVGIGTIAPAYKLDVCGVIRSNEVRVETGWCDYVFANDYELPALRDVETFIKANKHLPGVTPGAVIESEGLEVGKTSAQMIKKIEELTLYVIDLQKQVNALKKCSR